MRTEKEKMANLEKWLRLPKERQIAAIKRKQEKLRKGAVIQWLKDEGFDPEKIKGYRKRHEFLNTLTKEEQNELRQAARSVLESKWWGWGDERSGKHPREITTENENVEIEILLRKYLRIIEHGVTDEEFADTNEHIRFLVLKRCSFIDDLRIKPDKTPCKQQSQRNTLREKTALTKQVKAMGKKRFLAAIKRKQEQLGAQQKGSNTDS